MKLTGQAGLVMKESSEIAWSYLHSSVHKFAPGFTFFEKTQVHMHIPEGATPKDGPSAGITMATAMLSLLLDTPVLDNLGMTGELTLTGRILPIGGVKEKVVAARREGLEILIFPKENARDLDLVPDYIKQGLTIHFVEHYDEVFSIAFPQKETGAWIASPGL
jgi:ATP-dependent Lon protease